LAGHRAGQVRRGGAALRRRSEPVAMRVTKPNFGAVREVARNMRERDAAEFFAVSPFDTIEHMKEGLAARYGTRDDTYLFMWGDKPVAVGAMVQHRPHVVTLAFFATDDFPRIGVGLTRFVKQRLFPSYVERGVHRIECVSIEGYAKVHRWIEALGLS